MRSKVVENPKGGSTLTALVKRKQKYDAGLKAFLRVGAVRAGNRGLSATLLAISAVALSQMHKIWAANGLANQTGVTCWPLRATRSSI
jgi:hypothetical protein